MKKRILSLVLVLAIILGSSSFVSAKSDYANHWARLEIQYLVDEGIVTGYPGGEFRPNNAVTRAEFMRMINGAFELSKKGDVPFTDVSESDWYYEDIEIAIGEGYTSGYEDNTVKPNRKISRQEAATMIGRALGLEEVGNQSTDFTDSNKISNWAEAWVNAVVDKGYMQGYPVGDFRPLNNITRAETAKIIINVLGVNLEEDITGDLKVHYIDVGQGDSIFIELPNGEKALIDGGPRSSRQIVLNYLDEQDVEKIDYIIATHPHEDHIGGLADVINNYDIGKIYMPNVTHNTKTFENLLLAIQNKGKKITAAKAGDMIMDEEGLSIKILAPEEDYSSSNLNNYSIVIKLNYKDNSFLFTGDAESASENRMINEGYDLKSDVLKVGHHGSNTSTSDEFLDKVDPRYAVINVGVDNRYDHPHSEIINKLKSRNIEIFRTDIDGTIIAISDGKEIVFDTKR